MVHFSSCSLRIIRPIRFCGPAVFHILSHISILYSRGIITMYSSDEDAIKYCDVCYEEEVNLDNCDETCGECGNELCGTCFYDAAECAVPECKRENELERVICKKCRKWASRDDYGNLVLVLPIFCLPYRQNLIPSRPSKKKMVTRPTT